MFDPDSMAAYYAEQEMLAEIVQDGQIDREEVWVTKDGRRVVIKEMEDSHLLNTIRMLQGRSPHGTVYKTDDVTRRNLINVMANEAYRRGLQLL